MSLKSVVLPRMRRQRGWDCLLYCFVFRDGSSTRLVSPASGWKRRRENGLSTAEDSRAPAVRSYRRSSSASAGGATRKSGVTRRPPRGPQRAPGSRKKRRSYRPLGSQIRRDLTTVANLFFFSFFYFISFLLISCYPPPPISTHQRAAAASFCWVRSLFIFQHHSFLLLFCFCCCCTRVCVWIMMTALGATATVTITARWWPFSRKIKLARRPRGNWMDVQEVRNKNQWNIIKEFGPAHATQHHKVHP